MTRKHFILVSTAACIAVATSVWEKLMLAGRCVVAGTRIVAARSIRTGRGIWNVAANRLHARSHAAHGEPEFQAGAFPNGQEVSSSEATAASEENLDTVVQRMFANDRFALLLRPQIANTLDAETLAKAQDELDRRMSIVPDGDVQLEPNRLSAAAEFDVPEELLEPVSIHVAVTFLDRYPVTNRQYQAFVNAGGYDQMAIWDPNVWPAVLDFVDTTGKPGPRFWIDGRCPAGKEDHPVVGVCWYEAAAYARWVGRRLPTDAEWVKAASWPVNLPPATSFQRKYPWGNTMERQRANLWGSGPSETVPVGEFSGGVSVGGVYHLIGNVWEWTADEFLWVANAAETDADRALLKTVRGGAFDTYFDNQATSQFASGENPLGRKHNVGFRCALGICDLAATAPTPVVGDSQEATEEQLATA
jgi:gamma-glutamyl hercynylcysteine S-oxide synthase